MKKLKFPEDFFAYDNPDKYLFRLSKNKEGEIGDLPITFNKQIQRFQEYTWMG